MKKLNLIVTASLLLLLMTSCDWWNKILSVNFTTNSSDITFTVDPASAGNHQLKVKVMQSDLEQEIKDNGGSIANLKSVQMEQGTLSVVSAGRNLDAFKSLEVIISTDGMKDEKVAWVDNIPPGSTSVDLTLTTNELKDYINQNQYTVTINGVLAKDLTESIDLKVSVKYNVSVGP